MYDKNNSGPQKAVVLIIGLLFIGAFVYMGTTIHQLKREIHQHLSSHHTEAGNAVAVPLDRSVGAIQDSLQATRSEMRQSIQDVQADVKHTQKLLFYALLAPQDPEAASAVMAKDGNLQEFEKGLLAGRRQPDESRPTPAAAESIASPAATGEESGAPSPQSDDYRLQEPKVLGNTPEGRPIYASTRPNGSMVISRIDDRKMVVNFVDNPLETVVAALKQVSGLNFKLGEGIEEQTTLVLEKPISWERLLNVLLMRYNLEIENSGRELLLVRSGTGRG
jgi:hypothetical protein